MRKFQFHYSKIALHKTPANSILHTNSSVHLYSITSPLCVSSPSSVAMAAPDIFNSVEASTIRLHTYLATEARETPRVTANLEAWDRKITDTISPFQAKMLQEKYLDWCQSTARENPNALILAYLNATQLSPTYELCITREFRPSVVLVYLHKMYNLFEPLLDQYPVRAHRVLAQAEEVRTELDATLRELSDHERDEILSTYCAGWRDYPASLTYLIDKHASRPPPRTFGRVLTRTNEDPGSLTEARAASNTDDNSSEHDDHSVEHEGIPEAPMPPTVTRRHRTGRGPTGARSL